MTQSDIPSPNRCAADVLDFLTRLSGSASERAVPTDYTMSAFVLLMNPTPRCAPRQGPRKCRGWFRDALTRSRPLDCARVFGQRNATPRGFPVTAARHCPTAAGAVLGGIPWLLRSGVLALSAYATKMGRSLVLAYLARHRAVLAGLREASTQPIGGALWLSKGLPMARQTICACITARTRDAFGRPINPHLFRDCVATSIAIDDPRHIGIAWRLPSGTPRSFDDGEILQSGRRS